MDEQTLIRRGKRPTASGPAICFTGNVSIEHLFPARVPCRASGSSITFEAGTRSAWHTHPLGQILIVTAGKGLVQEWNGPLREISTGDVVWFPPDVKHWHGAAPDYAMTHIAICEAQNGKNAHWLEKVSNEQYQGKNSLFNLNG